MVVRELSIPIFVKHIVHMCQTHNVCKGYYMHASILYYTWTLSGVCIGQGRWRWYIKCAVTTRTQSLLVFLYTPGKFKVQMKGIVFLMTAFCSLFSFHRLILDRDPASLDFIVYNISRFYQYREQVVVFPLLYCVLYVFISFHMISLWK